MSEYRDLLEQYEDIPLCKISVASEVDCIYRNKKELTDKQFDMACEYIYDWCMNADISAREATRAFFDALDAGDFTWKDLRNDYEKARDAIESHIY